MEPEPGNAFFHRGNGGAMLRPLKPVFYHDGLRWRVYGIYLRIHRAPDRVSLAAANLPEVLVPNKAGGLKPLRSSPGGRNSRRKVFVLRKPVRFMGVTTSSCNLLMRFSSSFNFGGSLPIVLTAYQRDTRRKHLSTTPRL